MRKAFKASRLIGLLALALGLTAAFGATAAQAEPGAFWLVNATSIGTGLAEVNARSDTEHSTLLTTVGKTPVEILCLPIKFINGLLHELGRATGIIHYEGCTTILNKSGSPSANCKPHSVGDPAGLIETELLDGLLKLHTGGVELLELLPTVGTTFVTIELGPLCAIGEKFPITGKAFLEDCLKQGLVDQLEHLFKEGPLSALLFGTNPATIDGSAWGFLSGGDAGKTFAGHV